MVNESWRESQLNFSIGLLSLFYQLGTLHKWHWPSAHYVMKVGHHFSTSFGHASRISILWEQVLAYILGVSDCPLHMDLVLLLFGSATILHLAKKNLLQKSWWSLQWILTCLLVVYIAILKKQTSPNHADAKKH